MCTVYESCGRRSCILIQLSQHFIILYYVTRGYKTSIQDIYGTNSAHRRQNFEQVAAERGLIYKNLSRGHKHVVSTAPRTNIGVQQASGELKRASGVVSYITNRKAKTEKWMMYDGIRGAACG